MVLTCVMTPEIHKSNAKSAKNRVTFCDSEEIELDSLDSWQSQVSECNSEDEFVSSEKLISK